jgi:SCY1-like protein 1
MDSLDSDEALLLVTEQCTPLQQWLQEVNSNPATSKQNLVYELTWGFKGILKALDFLHSNCSLIHGNVGPHSIFITQNGDWKLGAFELACNVNNTDEVDYFCNNHNILETSLQPPERVGLRPGDSGRIDTALKSKVPPYYLDVFSFGRSVERVFEDTSTELSGSLSKYIATTVSSDMKKRPQAAKLLQAAVFNSDYIKILENVQEFSIKGQKEILESIKELDPLLPQMTVPICSHKVLPSVCKALQIAVNDFQNRDAREGCRQSIVVCVDLLSKLGSLKKIDEKVFQQECVNILTQLWAMTDRTIRTALLSSVKNLVELVPATVINNSLFDNMIAGFSDSNAKLREGTLMSLIYVVDKLDERQLQERLVRCISNLQNDPEASIRTNTTIFLGKIASKLKEPVRLRVLPTALAKSMKDNFVHCRIAGLKTAIASIKLIDVQQLATKIIPQVAILLLDKNSDVRNYSLSLMDASMERMRTYHDHLLQSAKENSAKDEERSAASGGAASTSANTSGAAGGASSNILGSPMLESWTTWGIQGISKTLDMDGSSGMEKRIGEINISTPGAGEKNLKMQQPGGGPGTSAVGRGNSNSIGDEFDSHNLDDSQHYFEARSYPTKGHESSASAGAWGDDDLDSALRFDDDESFYDNSSGTGNRTPGAGTKSTGGGIVGALGGVSSTHSSSNNFSSSVGIPKVSSFGSDISIGGAGKISSGIAATSSNNTAPVSSSKRKTAEKVAVKKLEFSKDDDWEDF